MRVAGFLLGLEQAVFVQAQAALDGALAHDDVVLLAAGEISKREGKLGVAHHAQIRLDAAGEDDGGLGFALGADADDARLGGECINDVRRFFGRGQKIDVADDLLETAQAAGGAAADDVGMRAQGFEDRLSKP